MSADFVRAATAIKHADFILIGAGAGMSADAGLPVFASISSNDVFKKLGLSYDQVAAPAMLIKDPALFYGFELSSADQYRQTPPHEGYSILLSWRNQIASRAAGSTRCFVVTSNVDGHFAKAGFPLQELSQIHGSLQRFQCGGVPNSKNGNPFPLFERGVCCRKTWPAPSPSTYHIDPATMRCQFTDGQLPKCPECKVGLNRPNIFLFGDTCFVEDPEVIRKREYDQWCTDVRDSLRSDSKLRLVILEIGCGLRVPSIRKRMEEMFEVCPTGQCEFIRINPEYPLNALKASCAPSIPIQLSGVAALRKINEQM